MHEITGITMRQHRNNKRLTLAFGVKLTPILLASALFFTETTVASESLSNPTGSIQKVHPDKTPRSTLLPSESGFFSSLRSFGKNLWDKNKTQSPHAEPKPAPAPSRTRTVLPDLPNIDSGFRNDQSVPNEPTLDSIAAQPVPNPRHFNESSILGDAPLPGQPANPPGQSASGLLVPMETSARPSSYTSYSFDTRDWVDYFPQQELEAPSRDGTIPNLTNVVEIQTTSIRTPISEPGTLLASAHFPSAESVHEHESFDQWNGQATRLLPFESVSEDSDSGKFPFDLTPSYSQRLRYTQTCGVVIVQANFPLTEIASILKEIERLQYDLTHYIGVPAPKEKIELCLFKDESSYNSFLREVFPRAPRDRRALYIKLDGKPGTLLVQKSKDFEIDLRHEMTHAILHASIPRVPIWLDEGLAKYFEVPIEDRAGNHQYMAQIRWSARLGMVPSLDRLAKLETIDDMSVKEYRDSWAWVHFLIHRSPETHQLLASYLKMLSSWDPREQSGRSGSLFGFRSSSESIPSLKLYLDDVLPNQREAFRDHFGK